MKCKFAVLVITILLCTGGPLLFGEGTEDKQSRIAAAHELFEAMQLDKTFAKSIEGVVDVQIKQKPTTAPYRKVMLEFFSKYMSWQSMKNDMAKIYADEFTTQELKEMTAFYMTPTGQKAALRTPQLMNKGAELGAKRVQEHMSELKLMLEREAKKLGHKIE